jgi:tetratricopeptide (TPR) repeat protein
MLILGSCAGLAFVAAGAERASVPSGIERPEVPRQFPRFPNGESEVGAPREKITHYLTLANEKIQKHDFVGAISVCDEAIKLDSSYPVSYYMRGLAKHAEGLPDAALKDFDDAIRLGPRYASPYIDRAWIKLEKFDYDGAISDCNVAIRLDPKQSAAYNDRGVAKKEQGEVGAALRDFNEALSLNPNYTLAYRNRGSTELRKGDGEAAIADFNRAIELSPKDGIGYLERGEARSNRGDFNGALADYSEALQLDSKISGAYVGRGNVERARGNLIRAEAEYRQAIQVDPKNGYALINLGIAKELGRDFEGALSAFFRAGERVLPSRRQDYLQFRIWLLRVRLHRGDEANERLANYLQNRSHRSPDRWTSNIGKFLLGKLTENNFLASASDPDPVKAQEQLCETWYYIGMKDLLSGDKKQAADDFRRCIDTKRTQFVEYILSKAELASL